MLIVGFGNSLMGDDGAGQAVVEALRGFSLPPGVRLEDGGSDALRLLSVWQGEPAIWLLDAVMKGAPPGTVHRLDHEAVLSIPQRHATAHQLSLPDSLRWLAIASPAMAGVRYRLWGIEPAVVGPRPGLSAAVAAAVASLAAEIAAALGAAR